MGTTIARLALVGTVLGCGLLARPITPPGVAHATARLDSALRGRGADVPACAGAGSPENAVVRFYQALARQRVYQAYLCLDPAERGRSIGDGFDATYMNRFSIPDPLYLSSSWRLLIAHATGGRGNGDTLVSIDVHHLVLDRGEGMEQTDRGSWDVSPAYTLRHPSLTLVRQVPVPVPGRMANHGAGTDVADIFAFDGRQQRRAVRARVTGEVPEDRHIDSLYEAMGPRGTEVWVFSHGSLAFFADLESPLRAIRLGTDRRSFDLITVEGIDHYVWDGMGFTPRPSTVVVQPAQARVGQLVTVRGVTLGSVHFLPPFLYLASTATHPVPRDTGRECGNYALAPLRLAYLRPVRTSPRIYAPRGATFLPPGMAWSATFRVPELGTPGVFRLLAFFGTGGVPCDGDMVGWPRTYAAAVGLTIL